jgi:hypothetical protein
MQRYRVYWRLRRAGVLVVLLSATSCRSATPREKLASTYPLDQVTGAVEVARQDDLQAIHRLVGLLDDRDHAVRMYAILALERMTGRTYGYEYYAPIHERAAAIERWQAALRTGAVSAVRPSERGAGPDGDPAGADEAGQPEVGRAGRPGR